MEIAKFQNEIIAIEQPAAQEGQQLTDEQLEEKYESEEVRRYILIREQTVAFSVSSELNKDDQVGTARLYFSPQ